MATRKDMLTSPKASRAVAEATRGQKGKDTATIPPAFDFVEYPPDPEKGVQFLMNFQMRAAQLADGTRVTHKRQGVRMSAAFVEALEALVPKNTFAAIVPLAFYAMQRIREEGLTVEVIQNRYTGIAAETPNTTAWPKPPIVKPKKAAKKATAKTAAVKKAAAKKKPAKR